jgi:hypothetical protein
MHQATARIKLAAECRGLALLASRLINIDMADSLEAKVLLE